MWLCIHTPSRFIVMWTHMICITSLTNTNSPLWQPFVRLYCGAYIFRYPIMKEYNLFIYRTNNERKQPYIHCSYTVLNNKMTLHVVPIYHEYYMIKHTRTYIQLTYTILTTTATTYIPCQHIIINTNKKRKQLYMQCIYTIPKEWKQHTLYSVHI